MRLMYGSGAAGLAAASLAAAMLSPAAMGGAAGVFGRGTAAKVQAVVGPPPATGAAPQESNEEEDVAAPEPDGLPEATVHFKGGRELTGLVVDLTDKELVLRVAGVNARFDRSTIDYIQRLPAVEERYLQMRRAIGDDGEQLTLLVRWLMERERFDLALREAKRAVTLAPDSTEAQRLLRVVEGRIELRQKSRPELADQQEPRPPSQGPQPRAPSFPLLTEAQINLLKVYEVDLDDPPRLVIPRRVVEELLERYADHPLIPVSVEGRDAILRWRDAQVLELIFRLRARDFYHRVEVLDNPESMKRFRDDVNRNWLVNSCATNRCHGGEQAGRLRLFNRRPSAEASYYTNFLILDRFRTEEGLPLIDYENPEQSVLLDYAVAREASLHPHPVVRHESSGRDEWRPAFRSKTDKRARETIDWIRSMYLPHPEYPVDYEPPAPLTPPAEPEPQAR